MKLATMLRTIYECPKPVIARVHGDAYAGGVGPGCRVRHFGGVVEREFLSCPKPSSG